MDKNHFKSVYVFSKIVTYEIMSTFMIFSILYIFFNYIIAC